MNRITSRFKKMAENYVDLIIAEDVDFNTIGDITNIDSEDDESAGSRQTHEDPGEPGYRLCRTCGDINIYRDKIVKHFGVEVTDEEWNQLINAIKAEANSGSLFGCNFDEYIGEFAKNSYSGNTDYSASVTFDDKKITIEAIMENHYNQQDEDDERSYWEEKRWEEETGR